MLIDTINKIKNVQVGYIGSNGLFDSATVNSYVSSLRGLSAVQAEVALSSAGLDKAQQKQILNKLAETKTTLDLTSAETIEALTRKLGSQEAAKDLLKKAGLVTEKQLETGVTITLNKELLNEAVLLGKISKEEANQILTTFGLTNANMGLTKSFSLLGKTIWATLKPILTNPFTWAIAGGIALAGVIDYLTLSYDEANEALDEANEKYKETESNISSLNDELATNEEKIEELKKLESDGTITDSQKEELENLEDKNEQLKTQIALQKELLELQNQDKAEAAKDVANAKSHSVAQSVKMGDETGKNTFKQAVISVTDPEAIKEDLALIDEYELKLSSLEEDLINAQKDVSNAESPFAKWTAELKVSNIKDEIQKYKDSLATLYEDLQTRSTNAQETLESLKLDPDANAAEIEIYETALASMETQLLDVKEAIESVNSMTISPSLSKEEMISQLNDMSEGFEELDKIYKSIKDDAPFDFKLLDDENFKNTFSGLDGYAEFFETITSNADNIDACQEAFNDLVSEWIDSKGILKGVTEENASLTASMLEQMGVVNASQIVTDVLKDQENATKFLESAEIDLVNATAEEINSLNILDGELAQSGGAIYDVYLKKKLTSENPIDTSADCNALIAMARQCQVTGENLALLIKLKNTYLTLESDMWGDATKQIAVKEAERLKAQLANTSFAADYKPVVSYKAPSTGKSSGSSSAAKDTKESFDWIQVKIERLEREISNLDKIVNATYKSWTDRNKALSNEISKVSQEIGVQEQAYNKYMSLANGVGLSDKYKKLVQSGAISYETIKDEKLIEKIQKYQEFYNLALEAKDAITDLQDELAALAKLSFENVVTQYEERLSVFEHEASVLEAYIDQVEAKGHIVSKSYYEELIKNEKQTNSVLRTEYTSLQAALKKAMADGSIKEGSSDWYDMMSSINDVELAIIESNTALVEFQKNIRDLEWESFDRLQDMISQITSEADFLIDLMSDEDLFNEKGQITDVGQATFGLHAVNYNTYMEQAKDYADEMLEIDKDLANDPYNVELLEHREELLQSHRDMIQSAEDEKQAMIDLAEEGYNKMLDYLNELIDKRKEALQAEKDIYDYEKNVREQTDEIARLQKIEQVVGGDTSEEGQLRAQQNAAALEEAREALQETEYEKYLSDQEQMLDTLASEAEQWVNERLDNVELLLSDIISATNENRETIKTTLEAETSAVGKKLSEEMSNIWKADGSAYGVVSIYGQGISNGITGVITVLERIEGFIDKMNKSAEEEAKKDVAGESDNAPIPGVSSGNSSGSSTGNNSTDNKKPSSDSNKSSTSSGWGSWFIKKKDSYPKSKLKIDTSIVDRLKYRDFDSSFTARAKYYAAMGLGTASAYTGSAKQNRAMISEMKKHGFNKGGRIGSLISATGEDGFVLANTGEYIFAEKDFKALSDMMAVAEPFIKTTMQLPTSLGSYNNNISNDVQLNISMHGVQDVQGLVSELQRNDRFQKVVQAMTVGKIAGANGLSKYKY